MEGEEKPLTFLAAAIKGANGRFIKAESTPRLLSSALRTKGGLNTGLARNNLLGISNHTDILINIFFAKFLKNFYPVNSGANDQ